MIERVLSLSCVEVRPINSLDSRISSARSFFYVCYRVLVVISKILLFSSTLRNYFVIFLLPFCCKRNQRKLFILLIFLGLATFLLVLIFSSFFPRSLSWSRVIWVGYSEWSLSDNTSMAVPYIFWSYLNSVLSEICSPLSLQSQGVAFS